jgi:hypothetical protein
MAFIKTGDGTDCRVIASSKQGIMSSNLVVMPGSKRANLPPLDAVARDFGWTVGALSGKTVAALISRDALGSGYSWGETLRQLRLALPHVRLITCHGFSDPIDWEELSEAGAFHAIHLPLKENELRQALGFVWEAERRSIVSIGRVPVAAAVRTGTTALLAVGQ